MNESQHRAAASRNADILEDPGATSDDLLARTAVPDADSRALDAVLYTETTRRGATRCEPHDEREAGRAERDTDLAAEVAGVLGVLGHLHLLDLLTHGRTIASAVLADDADLLGALGLRVHERARERTPSSAIMIFRGFRRAQRSRCGMRPWRDSVGGDSNASEQRPWKQASTRAPRARAPSRSRSHHDHHLDLGRHRHPRHAAIDTHTRHHTHKRNRLSNEPMREPHARYAMRLDAIYHDV